jgi:hypothetical protein
LTRRSSRFLPTGDQFAASGLAAAIIGVAGPAHADVIHHDWVYVIQPQVTVPHVDTSVHQSH